MGVLVEGDTPEGLSDLSGSIGEWTSSLFGEIKEIEDGVPDFAYPYHADDGREDVTAPPSATRVVRGGAWDDDHNFARASFRNWSRPEFRDYLQGFRLVMSSFISPDTLASGAA